MNTIINHLHSFLIENGVPEKELPKGIEVSKADFVALLKGYNKENKSKKFYVYVCTSEHNIQYSGFVFSHSGWSIRKTTDKILFSKGTLEFNISDIPSFNDVIILVSRRTKIHESMMMRSDIVCMMQDRKSLLQKPIKKRAYTTI
jgi:hypothetical protein